MSLDEKRALHSRIHRKLKELEWKRLPGELVELQKKTDELLEQFSIEGLNAWLSRVEEQLADIDRPKPKEPEKQPDKGELKEPNLDAERMIQ